MNRALPASITFTTAIALLALLAPIARGDFPLPPADADAIVVSSYGTHELLVYGADGDFVKRFTHEDLRGPRGLAFAPSGELFAAAQSSDRVLVFDDEGGYLRQFTGGGLDAPTGMAFAPDGTLHVSSFNSNEVLVFAAAGEHLRSYGEQTLRGPNCVAFRADGERVFVISQFSNRVYVFDAAGEFIEHFTGGDLSSAMGAAVFGDELFVTGGASDTVAVFGLDGTFRRNLTDELIDGPQGIAFDASGEFTVASFYTGKVARFTRDGERLGVFDEAGARIARSIALRPVSLEPKPFVRGDFNRDGALDLSDPVAILGHLFLGVSASRCLDAADSNDDGELNLTDAIFGLGYLFTGGSPPPPPFPDAGADETDDTLNCR